MPGFWRSFVGLSLLTALGALGVGCSGADAQPADPEEDEVTATRFYDCRANGDALVTRMELALGKNKAKVTDLGKGAAPPDDGTKDPSYKPSSPEYKDTTRFAGYDKIADTTHGEIGSMFLLVSPELMAKAASGKVWFRESGPEGGGTERYTCTSKPKALTVDTGLKARLLCDLDQIACGAGAPPGQTCLSDLFVQQTDGGATMRLTWLDHFGVNAKERKESLGDSSQLSRTKTGFHAKWSGGELDLDYRAGVTYKGTFKPAGGKVSNVTCSDMAMLD